MFTQDMIDEAYAEGKRAWRKYEGNHGPTLKPNTNIRPANPYETGTKLYKAWDCGWRQDVRRVIA